MTRLVRRWKGEVVKSRLVLKTYNSTKVLTGELYAATPSLGGLRTHLCLAAIDMKMVESRGETFVFEIWDASQAFIHAAIDCEVYAMFPEELHGVIIHTKQGTVTIYARHVNRLSRALYGYRRAPALWQNFSVDVNVKQG